jgi:hypothetical protein
VIIDRATVGELHAQLQQALEDFAEARGLKVMVGDASFTSNNVVFKVELAVVGPGGNAITREAEAFLHHAACCGLSPDHLGKTISRAGRILKIVGLNTRSRTAPILVADETGQVFKLPAATVRTLLNSESGSAS